MSPYWEKTQEGEYIQEGSRAESCPCVAVFAEAGAVPTVNLIGGDVAAAER